MDISKDLVILGDIHGKWSNLRAVCERYKTRTVLGLGDIGLGFPGQDPILPENFRFFRGNHDNPAVCKSHPKSVGDYGIIVPGVFVLAGGDSVDKDYRTAGVDWWGDEQLNREAMDLALDNYLEYKPEILVCHEAPFRLHELQAAASCTHNRNNEAWGKPKGNSTAFLLDSMIRAHMPKMLIHGHWHNPLVYKQWGCVFVSLGELEPLDLRQAMDFYLN
jgi:predicted phosphodiesterase